MTIDQNAAMPSWQEAASGKANCFGCAPTNHIGLQLNIYRVQDTYTSVFALGANYESYPGVVHGGIVATVLDEVMSQAIYQDCGRVAYTVGLRVRYGQPLLSGVTHVATAQVTHRTATQFSATARVDKQDEGLVAAANATFYPVPDHELIRLRMRLRNPEPVDAPSNESALKTEVRQP